MKKTHILKLNNFDTTFWKAKLGFGQDFLLSDYNSDSLKEAGANAQIVILDFYFSRTSMDEEQAIRIETMAHLALTNRPITLYVLSPSYAGETILKIKKSSLEVNCHNFSGIILEKICQHLESNNNTKKAS